jgi:hypothetical protein
MKTPIEVLDDEQERRKKWRERTRRIADEIRQSGQEFPDTTDLLREDRDR